MIEARATVWDVLFSLVPWFQPAPTVCPTCGGNLEWRTDPFGDWQWCPACDLRRLQEIDRAWRQKLRPAFGPRTHRLDGEIVGQCAKPQAPPIEVVGGRPPATGCPGSGRRSAR